MDGGVPRAVELVSVTDLTSYLFCPRLLYQQRVLGYVEKPNAAMILGSIRHSFHDNANKGEEEIVVNLANPESFDAAAQAYSTAYKQLIEAIVESHAPQLSTFGLEPRDVLPKLQPIVLADATERAGDVSRFASQHCVSGEELWRMLLPKILTEFKVKSPALRLKGVVDRVELHDGFVLPVELKTGKMSRHGVWPSHRVQVAAYMMLLQERFNAPVNRAVIRYLDHQSSRTVSFNPYMENEVKELTEKVVKLLQSEAVPEPCGKESCSCHL